MVIETGYVKCEMGGAYIMHWRHEISICIFRYMKCVTLGEWGVFIYWFIHGLFRETLSDTDNVINISSNICTLLYTIYDLHQLLHVSAPKCQNWYRS